MSWQHYCTASSSGRQQNFAVLNRGRHLCSAGRPSGWALAHILVMYLCCRRLCGLSCSRVNSISDTASRRITPCCATRIHLGVFLLYMITYCEEEEEANNNSSMLLCFTAVVSYHSWQVILNNKLPMWDSTPQYVTEELSLACKSLIQPVVIHQLAWSLSSGFPQCQN